MKIGINALQADLPRYGISSYTDNLVRELVLNGDHQFELFLRKGILQRYSGSNVSLNALDGNRTLLELFSLPLRSDRLGLDVFHNTDHFLPVLPFKAKKVMTVHDLSFLRFPRFFQKRRTLFKKALLSRSLRIADRIIADSFSTKRDLVELAGVRDDRIDVVHLAAEGIFKPVDDRSFKETVLKKYGITGRFLLFLGTLEPRKNVASLIRAYEALKDAPCLVIAGRKGWLYEEIFKAASVSKAASRIKFIGPPDQSDLPALYSSCEAFVYPSLFEGFGIPALEAMSCGAPVVTSNVSSIPEVTGDAAVYVDPNDIASIADGIRSVLNSVELRSSLSSRGIERAAMFSWKKSAQLTLNAYEKAVSA